jgi:Family of unknown function (DUF6448)
MMNWRLSIPSIGLFTALLLQAWPAAAHCDTMDGPVVSAARDALSSGDINRVLIWVPAAAEPQLRARFQEALSRRKTPDASESAERAFFEEVVRIHREGEGVRFQGLKPAGTAIEPAVVAADEALANGDITAVSAVTDKAVRRGLEERYGDVRDRRSFDPSDLNAGRAYVASYVGYTHWVEAVHAVATQGPTMHEHEGSEQEHTNHAGHAAHLGYIGWVFSAVLGVGLLGQTVIVRRRKRSASPPRGDNDAKPASRPARG